MIPFLRLNTRLKISLLLTIVVLVITTFLLVFDITPVDMKLYTILWLWFVIASLFTFFIGPQK